MFNLTPSGEVAEFRDFDQFVWNESKDQCGPASVSMFWHSTRPGAANPWSAAACQAMMYDDYTHFIGPDVPADTRGTSNQQLYTMIQSHKFAYLPIPKSVELIKLFGAAGYTVIIGIVESSVEDLGLETPGCPYSWDPAGLSHIVTVSGPGSEGELLIRDTANIAPDGVRPGPRRYNANKLVLLSATVCVPSWLPGL